MDSIKEDEYLRKSVANLTNIKVGTNFECACFSCNAIFWKDGHRSAWSHQDWINSIIDKRLFPSENTSFTPKKPSIESKTKRPPSLNETCIKELGRGAFGRVELCKIRATDGTEMHIAVKTVNLSKKAESAGITTTDGKFCFSGMSFFTQVETETQLAHEELNMVLLENEKNVGLSADERYIVQG